MKQTTKRVVAFFAAMGLMVSGLSLNEPASADAKAKAKVKSVTISPEDNTIGLITPLLRSTARDKSLSKFVLYLSASLAKFAFFGVKPASKNKACSFIILAKNKCSSSDKTT